MPTDDEAEAEPRGLAEKEREGASMIDIYVPKEWYGRIISQIPPIHRFRDLSKGDGRTTMISFDYIQFIAGEPPAPPPEPEMTPEEQAAEDARMDALGDE